MISLVGVAIGYVVTSLAGESLLARASRACAYLRQRERAQTSKSSIAHLLRIAGSASIPTAPPAPIVLPPQRKGIMST